MAGPACRGQAMTPETPFEFPPRLSLAQLPTPFQPLPRLQRHLGCRQRLWIKRDDLTGSVLSGNKVRKLEFTLAEALLAGADTIVTCGGVQSNHCRATALLCARLGLHCVLVLRGEAEPPFDGNLLLSQLAGAELRLWPVRTYQHNLDALLAETIEDCRAQGRQPFLIPTGASDAIGVWGYIGAVQELQADFAREAITRAHLLCATGSGGTQAGLTAGAALLGLPATVWGVAVCDDEQWFLDKVRSDLQAWQERYQVPLELGRLQVQVLDAYIGPGYARAGREVFETIQLLASLEGMVLDPVYTGKAFLGLLTELRSGRFDDVDDIVFVHTGGVFGLFPQRDQVVAS